MNLALAVIIKMRTHFLYLFIVVLASCNGVSEKQIVGNWTTFETKGTDGNEKYTRFIFRENGEFIETDEAYHNDSYGTWTLSWNKIIVDYNEGTGTEYTVSVVNDSTLVLIEDDPLFVEKYNLRRTRYEKDTLKVGTFFAKDENLGFPKLVLIDADSEDTVKVIKNSSEQFVWIICDRLWHYRLDAKLNSGGVLKRTAVYGQYELLVNKDDPFVELVGQIDFKGDSIFIHERNWTDSSESSYTERLYLFDGMVTEKIPVE